MDKLGNVLQTIMWIVVVLAVIIFVTVIIVGHTNSFDFFYSFNEENDVVREAVRSLIA